MIIGYFPISVTNSMPNFIYASSPTATESDLDYLVEYEAGGWKVKFLSVGTGYLIMKTGAIVDAFLVGGGGTGSSLYNVETDVQVGPGGTIIEYGGGGGGGYTLTQKSLTLTPGNVYTVVVGASDTASSFSTGDASEWDEQTYTAAPGEGWSHAMGGNGGSGGAPRGTYWTVNGQYYSGSIQEFGGTNGSDSPKSGGGKGQGTTTREFGETSGTLYSDGGLATSDRNYPTALPANSGNGGVGGRGGAGASGIVIIRNARER